MLRCKAFTLLLSVYGSIPLLLFTFLIKDTKKVKIETDNGVLHLIPLNGVCRVSFHKKKHLYQMSSFTLNK